MADHEERLVNNPTEEPTISPDTEPTMYEKVRNEPWFGWAVRVLLAIILIVLIFFGARWIHHRTENKHVNTVPAKTRPLPSTSPNGGTAPGGTSKPTTSGNLNSGGSSANNSTSGSAASGKGPGTSGQLSNTGPGDVVAILLATSFVAAGLHYAVNSRRES